MHKIDGGIAATSIADTDFTVLGKVAILRSNQDWSHQGNERKLLYFWIAGAIVAMSVAGWTAMPWVLMAALVLFVISRTHAVAEVIDRAEFDADVNEVRIFRRSANKRRQETYPFSTISSIGIAHADTDDDRGMYKLAMLMADDGRNINLATGFRYFDEWNTIVSRIGELTGIARLDRLSGCGP